MTVLGYNTIGAHIDNNLPDRLLADGYYTTDAVGGVLQNANVYFSGITNAGVISQACRFAIWGSSGTEPTTTLIGVTDELIVDNTTSVGWKTFSSWTNFGGAPTLAPLTNYWIGMWWGTQVGGDARWEVEWDFGSLPGTLNNTVVTYSSTANPVVSSWTDAGTTQEYSWYLNYTPAPASSPTFIASLGRRPVPMIKGPDKDRIMRMYRR